MSAPAGYAVRRCPFLPETPAVRSSGGPAAPLLPGARPSGGGDSPQTIPAAPCPAAKPRRRRAPDLTRRQAIVDLREEGLSDARIAARLGITKNAVAGHCYRARAAGIAVKSVGLFGPQPAAPGSPTAAKKRRAASRRAAEVLPGDIGQKTEDGGQRTEVGVPASRRRTCQFIAGEKGRDFKSYRIGGVFCGAAARLDSSYCPEHHARCRKAPLDARTIPSTHPNDEAMP